jgi:hypothetical protein
MLKRLLTGLISVHKSVHLTGLTFYLSLCNLESNCGYTAQVPAPLIPRSLDSRLVILSGQLRAVYMSSKTI